MVEEMPAFTGYAACVRDQKMSEWFVRDKRTYLLTECQHGSCDKPFECNCDPGWSGSLCNNPVCKDDCGPHGSCR